MCAGRLNFLTARKRHKRTFRDTLFPPVELPWRAWRDQVVLELRRLEDGRITRDRLDGRATAVELCIRGVSGHECRCGAPLPGSGRLTGNGEPCQSRTCPRCAQRRTKKTARWLRAAVRLIGPGDDRLRWRLITLTCPRDVMNPDHYTVNHMRAQIDGLRAAWSSVWKRIGGTSCAAWFNTEMGSRGNVHLHALYFGPWVDRRDGGELLEAARGGWSGVGEIRDVREVADPVSAVPEVSKYALKTPGAHRPHWFAGASFFDSAGVEKWPKVIDPVLAARWEVACWGRRLNERYGLLRKVVEEVPLVDEPLTELSGVPCPSCSRIGEWFSRDYTVEGWARMCVRADCRPFGAAVVSRVRAGPSVSRPVSLLPVVSRRVIYQMDLALGGAN